MITNKQLLTFALILTLAPQTTQPSALKDTIKDFATEHPLIVGGAAITLVGVGAFMGGRASRNLELSNEKERVTGVIGQLTQQTNEANLKLQQTQRQRDEANLQLQQAQDAITAANKQRNQDLQAIMKQLDGEEADPANLSVERITASILNKHTATGISVSKLDTEVKELKAQLAQRQEELSTLINTSQENLNTHATLNDTKDKNIELLKEEIAQLKERIKQKDLFIQLTQQDNQQSIRQKDALIQLTQKTNTELRKEIIEAYEALLKDTAPGNYAPQNKQSWFTQRGFTEQQQTALNSLIACMQVLPSTINPITGKTTESSTVFHDQPHTTRLSTRTVPADGDAIFADKPAATPSDTSAAPATPKPGRRQWSQSTTPVHFDIAATSSDAVTAGAAAQQDDNDNPSTTC